MKHHIVARSFAGSLITLLLSACGGGGGGGDGGSGSPPATQAVGGIWRAQYTAGSGSSVTIVGLVAEDGQAVFFSKPLGYPCRNYWRVGIGSISADGTSISGSATDFLAPFSFVPRAAGDHSCGFVDGSTSASETITGTVAQRSTLTLTGTDTLKTGEVLPSLQTVTATFDPLYNAGSSLAAIAGNWTGPSAVVMNINSNGVIFAQDPVSGCVVNGQVSLINSSYNVYAVSATYSNCAGPPPPAWSMNGRTATGLAAVDDTVSPNMLYIGYSTIVAGTPVIVAATATR